ncbi:MAG: biotin--[acetyl-CoA-carboxylase] ligase [Bacteroidales bacterium]
MAYFHSFVSQTSFMGAEDKALPQVIRLKETGSTNLYLREYMATNRLLEGSVVIADAQTAGRGQTGNSWESEPGANLTFSIVLYPCFLPANRQFALTQITSLAVKETLDACTSGIRIKWPNDLYWKDKKAGGILIENDLSGGRLSSSVVGIGLNLNQTLFPANLPNPVSLKQITGKSFDREQLFSKLLANFHKYYRALRQDKDGDIRQAYMNALYRNDGFYPYRDAKGLFDACIQGVDELGYLRLRLRNGEVCRYAFKEVCFLNQPY